MGFIVRNTELFLPKLLLYSDCIGVHKGLILVAKFEDLLSSNEGGETETSESCAVCLSEFEGEDKIRQFTNCCHILDRWMDHDQKTCPLCRTPYIPDEMQKAFNERLWAASGILEFYGGAGGVWT
ncbi:hypothetical protein GIB67_022442 [Kingdonia uniflora]|uniref:RING-type domain-containing protein n=1 Tax=Kingdonia uniflora TaxID=39325 RepID=A0A7J7MU82_9MAGN|nr:hypothetical protein GIB67_022442 [Kingdonia uniflora]